MAKRRPLAVRLDEARAKLHRLETEWAAYCQRNPGQSHLTAYDLERPPSDLYPVLTPLKNMIPRVSGKAGIQAAWKGIVRK